MKPEEFNRIVSDCWESIAFIAFDGFHRMGRGVVTLMDENDSLEQSYHVFNEDRFDSHTARLIREYDPAWEVLVQYVQPDGSPVTLRLRTRPDQRHPWRVWLSTRMDEEEKS